MLNKVYLIGNLTRDPETKYTVKGTCVGEIGIAVNQVWKDDAGEKREDVTFVDVTVWGKTAELCGQYLKKGAKVLIEGKLSLDQWEDKTTGQKRSKLKVVAENVQFLSPRTGERATEATSGRAIDAKSVPADDESADIPF